MCFTQSFWQLTISGLALGSVYALIALGYTLVYGVLQLINFAHSEVFMLGGFGGLFLVRGFGVDDPHGITSVLLVGGGMIAGALLGAATAFTLERVAYRPLRRRGAPRLAFLISAIGASFFLLNLAGKEFGRFNNPMPPLYTSGKVFSVFSAQVTTNQLVVAASAVVMLIALDRIIAKTRLGMGIRSVAQDAEAASLMGVDIDKVITRTFVLGGLLGGAAGFLFGIQFGVQYNMGFSAGTKAFTAAVLGGIGNVRGAVMGGLVLGVAENLGVACVSSAWRDVIAFLILVLVLMLRPTGILGERLGRSA
ncbi:MAG: branched-chain amino acid transport system permease protein [Actinomycetota bacterium]|jgi:branched-chain amino acid transport system permease protein|nr:branched-chain amino acid transport system permease protein [Actinomycetota bacterium]